MPASPQKRPCRFCQQSRWVLTFVILGVMATMLFLQQAG